MLHGSLQGFDISGSEESPMPRLSCCALELLKAHQADSLKTGRRLAEHGDDLLQVKKELEEERQIAEEDARRAQEAIKAKQAELAQIEAARKAEVRSALHCRVSKLHAASAAIPDSTVACCCIFWEKIC